MHPQSTPSAAPPLHSAQAQNQAQGQLPSPLLQHTPLQPHANKSAQQRSQQASLLVSPPHARAAPLGLRAPRSGHTSARSLLSVAGARNTPATVGSLLSRHQQHDSAHAPSSFAAASAQSRLARSSRSSSSETELLRRRSSRRHPPPADSSESPSSSDAEASSPESLPSDRCAPPPVELAPPQAQPRRLKLRRGPRPPPRKYRGSSASFTGSIALNPLFHSSPQLTGGDEEPFSPLGTRRPRAASAGSGALGLIRRRSKRLKARESRLEPSTMSVLDIQDVAIEVLAHCDVQTVVNVSLTCKRLHALCNENSLWHNLSITYFGAEHEYRLANWKAFFAECYLLSHSRQLLLSKEEQFDHNKHKYRHTGVAYKDMAVVVGGSGLDPSTTYGDVLLFECHPYQTLPRQTSYQDKKKFRFPDGTQCTLQLAQPIIPQKSDGFVITRHTCVVIGSDAWIWGGSASSSSPSYKRDTLIRMNLESMEWQEITQFEGRPPTRRSDHAAAAVGDVMYVFGGSDSQVIPQNDLHRFDTKGMRWERIESKGDVVPFPRSGHCLVSHGRKLYLYGGAQWNPASKMWLNKCTEMTVFDCDTETWSTPAVHGTPPPSSTFAAMFVLGNHIWLIGGGRKDEPDVYDGVHTFNLVTHQWEKREMVRRAGKDKWDFSAKDCVSAIPLQGGSKVLLVGGFRGQPFDTVQILTMKWVEMLRRCGLEVQL